jgi:hypothetical protein
VVGDWNFKEESTQRHLQFYAGRVRVHPAFTPQFDGQGELVSSHADLAVIQLDEPAQERPMEVRWAKTGARLQEWLVMVGFGQQVEGGGFPGVRYSRRNTVTHVSAEPQGPFDYEQQGAFLYEGFPGGPCFREERQERWLLGIASQGSKRGLSCTSLSPYQAWLKSEVQRVKATPLSPRNPTPHQESREGEDAGG